jgi:hypothetical protein
VDFRISRNFLGNPLDFGAMDLTFQGPVSLELSTGGRLVPQLDVNLTTAITSRSTAAPLSYEFNCEFAGQSVEVPGTFLVDAGLAIDKLGFYNLGLTLSSRQQVLRQGESAGEGTTRDFDIGPVTVAGNIYADALALITQPVYERLGQENPFEAISGLDSLSDLLMTYTNTAKSTLASGFARPVEDEDAPIGGVPPLTLYHGLAGPAGSAALVPERSPAGNAAIPEPTALLLVLLTLPAMARRRVRR